jgi:two-component system chemotaxis response regulator CheY
MGKRVMAVKDSATVRKVLQATMVSAGYEVVESVDIADALEKLSGDSVDMLVTALNMSSLDGIGLIQEVRQKPGNRFMPIIMLASESQPEKKECRQSRGRFGVDHQAVQSGSVAGRRAYGLPGLSSHSR